MAKFVAAARKFVRDEEGAAIVEYGLLVCLIALGTIAALTLLGGNLSSMFSGVAGTVAAQPTTGH